MWQEIVHPTAGPAPASLPSAGVGLAVHASPVGTAATGVRGCPAVEADVADDRGAPAPTRPPPAAEPRLLGRVTVAGAALSLVGFAVALVLLVLPVRVPEVQDCGTAAGFLLDGRIDTVPDAEGRILDAGGSVVTLADDVAETARRAPCSSRVADRAVPAAVLVATSTLLGLVALSVESFVVRPRRRRARAAAGPGT